MPVTVVCKNCGVEFTTAPSRIKSGKSKFCSRECLNASKRKDVACQICGAVFSVPVGQPRSFCSQACANRRQVRHTVEHTCKRCGETFWAYAYKQRKYCSLYCRQENHKVAQTCQECGAVFYKTDWSKPKYCSKACMDAFNRYRIEGDVAYIELTNRKREFVAEAIIDAPDLEQICRLGRRISPVWDPYTKGYRAYVRLASGKTVFIHQIIADTPPDKVTDHINLDPLDCRRANLRAVTRGENNQNRAGATRQSSTGVRNVYWDGRRNNYQVKLQVKGKRINIGRFDGLEEAEQAAITARQRYFTHSTR